MTDKQMIIKWINNKTLYEKDYDTLNVLLHTNNRFFVRVMTEIAKGNLQLSDFETVIGGPSYDSRLKENFVLSEKMQKDLELVLSANDAINGFNEGLNKSIYENLLVESDKTALIEEVEEDDIYNFFKYTPEASLMYRVHKEKMLAQYNNGFIDTGFLNLYIGIPIIPINYNDVILTEDDKLFALTKGITIDEVKKIKSLNYYYRSKSV